MMDRVERLRTALAGRYEIQRELGQGGMATVYLANDLKHARQVAIKVLHPSLTASLGAVRFLREIKIAAGLQHPHILPLHDSGEADGLLFYVMPYVDGESLAERLARKGELPIPEAVRILRDVADALAAAHARDVVHRDIKPDNVLVSGRHALVADFGVAKAVSEAAAESTLTGTGVSLGTPRYMAPEQAAAEAVDQRSDIYAFGVLAYEALVGRPPFEGDSAQVLAAAHLTQEPVPLTARRPAVPPALAHLVMKCLEKRPADRWQNANELVHELERQAGSRGARRHSVAARGRRQVRARALLGLAVMAAAGATAAVFFLDRGPALDPRRVVVLPFDDRTGDPALESVGGLAADWLARELERGLGEVMDVVSPASVRDALRSPIADSVSLLGLARLVAAGTAIAGTARLAEGRLRMEPEIVNARSGTLIQALDPVSGPRDSAEAVVGALAERIVAAVAVRFSPDFQRRRGQRPAPSLEAFRQVEAGLTEFADGRYRLALDHFERARALDSTYVEPQLHAFAAYFIMGYQDPDQMQKAESVLVALTPRRHLLTAEERAELEWKRGWMYGDLEAEYRAAEEWYRLRPGVGYSLAVSALRTNRPARAIEAMSDKDLSGRWQERWPAYWSVYAAAYRMAGRQRDALKVIERGRRVLPDELSLIDEEIQIRAALGQTREISQLIERALTLTPDGAPAYAMVAANAALEYRAHGHPDASESALRRALDWLTSRPSEEAQTPGHRYARARVLYWSGRYEEALPLFEELTRERPGDANRLGFLGTTLAHLGRRDEALRVAEDLRTLERPYLPGANTRGLAQIAAVLGDSLDAVRLLRQAIQEGQPYVLWPHREPDFERLRAYPPFVEVLRPQG